MSKGMLIVGVSKSQKAKLYTRSMYDDFLRVRELRMTCMTIELPTILSTKTTTYRICIVTLNSKVSVPGMFGVVKLSFRSLLLV